MPPQGSTSKQHSNTTKGQRSSDQKSKSFAQTRAPQSTVTSPTLQMYFWLESKEKGGSVGPTVYTIPKSSSKNDHLSNTLKSIFGDLLLEQPDICSDPSKLKKDLETSFSEVILGRLKAKDTQISLRKHKSEAVARGVVEGLEVARDKMKDSEARN